MRTMNSTALLLVRGKTGGWRLPCMPCVTPWLDRDFLGIHRYVSPRFDVAEAGAVGGRTLSLLRS